MTTNEWLSLDLGDDISILKTNIARELGYNVALKKRVVVVGQISVGNEFI